MPASVCQHESGRFIGPVKDKPRRYWHYRIGQFPVFQRQTAAFSADLTLELSKSHQALDLLLNGGGFAKERSVPIGGGRHGATANPTEILSRVQGASRQPVA